MQLFVLVHVGLLLGLSGLLGCNGDHVARTFRTDNRCLKGPNHKSHATPEGPDYAACHQYRTKSCCTADFTKKLAQATVTNIDNFYWNRCGNLSLKCEEFMIAVECFYRCSPNVIHWEGDFQSSLDRVPVCHQFCDDWYEACKDDLSCATNWITGFNSSSGSNHCKSDSTCQTWAQRYTNSEQLCNVMWGSSFRYTTDDNKCLMINGTDLSERNNLAAQRILSAASSLQMWSFLGPLCSLFTLAVGSAFY